MNTSREVLMAAAQIREKATEEVIKWGRLILLAEADKKNEAKRKAAMTQGQLVQTLAMALAQRFG